MYPTPSLDLRTAWIATCVFWAWAWAVAAVAWTPFTLGLSLVMLIPAGLSAWSVMIPVGKPPAPVFGPPMVPPHPHYPPQLPRSY